MARGETLTLLAIAAPGQALAALQQGLRERGHRLQTLSELPAYGSTLREKLVSAVKSAELVICVTGAELEPSLAFELGIAVGAGVPVIVLASSPIERPASMAGLLYTSYDPLRPEPALLAIDRAVSTIGSAEHDSPGRRRDTTAYAAMPEMPGGAGAEFESWVAEFIRRTGVDVFLQPAGPSRSFDLAVYSSDLELAVGNPLLVEVKYRLPRDTAVIRRLQDAAAQVRAQWVLLLHAGDAPPAAYRDLHPSNVLIMSVKELGSEPLAGAFVQRVRALRNLAAHGLRQV